MSRREVKKKEENQLQVAQQHLANERTYLAWVRTAIAIIGIGFVTISFHLTIGESHQVSDLLAILISILSGIFGVSVIVAGVWQYLRKRRQIQHQDFHSSYKFILFVSVFLILIIFLAGLYILSQFM